VAIKDLVHYTTLKTAWDKGEFKNESPETQAATAEKIQKLYEGSQEVSGAARIAQVLPYFAVPLIGLGSKIFPEASPSEATGYVPGPEGDVAALAMENPAISAPSPEFSAFALQAESEFLAPEAVGLAAEPSFWDKLYSAGKSAVGGVGTASNVYSALTKEVQDVQNILSPVFQSDYPTVADRTGSQEYTKIEDQDRVLGSENPFTSFFGTAEDELVDGETGSSSLVIVGGVVLLLLFLRR